MTPTTTDAVNARAVSAARFMNRYARRYSAGAFATPTAAEISKLMAAGEGWYWWDTGVMAVGRRLTRDSLRADFTGRRVRLPAGANVISHLAHDSTGPIPDMDGWDWLWTYVEDEAVTAALRAQGREVAAVRVSAASELIACWGRPGTGHTYSPVDAATIVRLPLDVPGPQRAAILAELQGVNQWHDDYPFYSDGSWGAVSLRGFNPADPTWGVKPSEMGKAWHEKHPEAAQYSQCGWTVLAGECPHLVDLTRAVTAGWAGELERVRLLRMAGRGGRPGRLGRHTDITDRASGTGDGQIIRLHIPLVTHPDITMSGWNLAGRRTDAHLPAWSLWYLDARKPHAVDNPTGIDRVHLVIDVQADAGTRAAIAAGQDAAA